MWDVRDPKNSSTKIIKTILVTFKPKTHELKTLKQEDRMENLLIHINKAIVRLTQQEEADKES